MSDDTLTFTLEAGPSLAVTIPRLVITWVDAKLSADPTLDRGATWRDVMLANPGALQALCAPFVATYSDPRAFAAKLGTTAPAAAKFLVEHADELLAVAQ